MNAKDVMYINMLKDNVNGRIWYSDPNKNPSTIKIKENTVSILDYGIKVEWLLTIKSIKVIKHDNKLLGIDIKCKQDIRLLVANDNIRIITPDNDYSYILH